MGSVEKKLSPSHVRRDVTCRTGSESGSSFSNNFPLLTKYLGLLDYWPNKSRHSLVHPGIEINVSRFESWAIYEMI